MASPFYERRRRAAYRFATASVLLLLAGLAFGFFIETYGNPRVAAGPEGAWVMYNAASTEDEEARTRVVAIDAAGRPAELTRLLGRATGVTAHDGELTLFFSRRASILKQGTTVRNEEFDFPWEVVTALRDRDGRTWTFGYHAGDVVARPSGGATIVVAPSSEFQRLSATAGDSGPVVAWKPRGSLKVRTARFEGTRFVPHDDFEIGDSEYWDLLWSAGRAILFFHHSDDRSFSGVTLRLRCCASCGKPPPPGRISLPDPLLLLGRKVTGVAVAAAGDSALLVLTRQTTVQSACLPAATLSPPPGTALEPLAGEPLWRRAVALVFPVAMLFNAVALVCLGFVLIREQSREAAGIAAASPSADVLQRIMACLLDLILLVPLFLLVVEFADAAPETSDFDLADPRVRATALAWIAVRFGYHFLLEWLAGGTPGKKILGLKAVELDGSRLTLRGALVRNLFRALDADVHLGVLIGTICIMVTRRRQRPGDILARTIVVEDRPPA